MKYPKIPLAQTLIELCKARQIQSIVISPGSRNAPLAIGFTNDDFFKCYSIVDERCAAFFALGIAQQKQTPVALVCTSGSALLNYYPAVAEAFYSDIPLVVLSADRPKHLIDIGDGQTINQKNVFENHILYSANLKLDLKDEYKLPENEDLPIFKNLEGKLERFLGLQQDIQSFNETEINTAFTKAIFKKGPVHINIPFDEPLYEMIDAPTIKLKRIEIDIPKLQVEEFEVKQCLEDWNSESKKMILVGVNQPNLIEKRWLEELAMDDSVLVLTETTSNLHNNEIFSSIDKLIAPLTDEEFKALQPDILLTFGGMVVSKKIKSFLRKYKPKQHWHIDLKKAYDTYFCLEKHIEADPNDFFTAFIPKITHFVKSDYHTYWSKVKEHRSFKHEEYLKQIPFSDFKVFDKVLKALPDHSVLQLSNSSTVRYTQLFDLNHTIDVFCNRGTSGIEGSTSTAIGCAVANEKQTTLITGDLSFFYDSNALWNNYIPNNFRIIIVNNNGGGIFRILPGHKNTQNFDTYFETVHGLTAKQLCKMFNFEYATVSNESQLKLKLKTFFQESSSPKLLEVFTPREQNDEILLNYFNFIK
jgi:2-succinyl-5-enolpyruvyl-6-hydroxy-3-cyclohexene-1-carboxylate synthase